MKFYRGTNSPRLIYFIKEEGSNYVKIGSSRTPETRLMDLQVSNPRKLKLLRMVDAGKGAEAAFHKLFDQDRVRGEWFYISDELDKFIKQDDDYIMETIELCK